MSVAGKKKHIVLAPDAAAWARMAAYLRSLPMIEARGREDESHRRFFVNSSVPLTINGKPVAPLARAVCHVCGHGFSELMINTTSHVCRDCKLEMAASLAAELEDAGINLGWGGTSHLRDMCRDARMEWRRRQDMSDEVIHA